MISRRFPLLKLLVLMALLAIFVSYSPGVLPQDSEHSAAEKKLPPLVLPPLPGEKEGKQWQPPAPKAAPPSRLPELPVPEGPAKVNSSLPVGKKYFFKLLYDGVLVGYSTYIVRGRLGLAGEDLYIINSYSVLKLGVGSVSTTAFKGKLMIDRKNLRPAYYRCEQKAGGEDFLVECVYSKSTVAQTNRGRGQDQLHIHNYDSVPALVFNNLWGHWDTFPDHYALLIRSAYTGGKLQAYDPIVRGGGTMIVYAPREEMFKFEGRKVATLVYPVSDMEGGLLAEVRVSKKNFELLEVREIGRGMTMVRTGSEVVKMVDKAPGLDLKDRRIVLSNVLFPEPEKLTELEADIEIYLRGNLFADHRILGYRQYFTGELRPGYMKGRVAVRAVPREGTYNTHFPLHIQVPEGLNEYLRAGPGVELDYPPLQNKARELTWKSGTTFQAVRRLNNFVGNLEEGVALPSARFTLESGVGNAESKALLMIALARSLGLPARRVGGLLYRDGKFIPHHWVEVWLGMEEGWVPFDPTTFESGRVSAAHIALWGSGDLQKVSLRVIDYAPRAVTRVKYFKRELNWPVGEKRYYVVYRDGEKVGEEVAAVKELEVRSDEEVYRFTVSTNRMGKKPFQAEAEITLNPKALPLEYELNWKSEKNSGEEHYEFVKDTVRFKQGSGQQDGDSALVREIPFSFGTYLADPRFLSQWALVIGQTLAPVPLDTFKVGEKLNLFVFIPQSLKAKELVLEVKKSTQVKLGEKQTVQTRVLESEDGMLFYLNGKSQVVKIAVPDQDLEAVLERVQSVIP